MCHEIISKTKPFLQIFHKVSNDFAHHQGTLEQKTFTYHKQMH